MSARIRIPRPAEEIIRKLNEHGFEAYVVGGCVRDALMGREPEDWDITTSAKPEQVKAVFGRTVDTGIRHGTVTVMRGRTGYEVTTYRIDGEYEDGRHPRTVEFTPDLREDLKRRDFTINAMAYNSESGLVDAFGGQEDLKAGRIRCVGWPEERFREDALRILRALRFAAQLGFSIEEGTEAAMRVLAPNLVHVSKERIAAELTKLLLSGHPDEVRRVFSSGASAWVSDTFARIDPEKIAISAALPAEKGLRWAAFLRHQTLEEAKRILRELKLDKDTIARVGLLTEWWREPAGGDAAALRRTMSQMPPEMYDDVLRLKAGVLQYYEARQECGNGECREARQQRDESEINVEIPEYDRIPETSADLRRIWSDTVLIRARGDCVSLKTLAVSGNDLIAAGYRPGKELGALLDRLLQLVLEHPEKNTREELMDAVSALAGR